jgi:hypothetical protein
LWLIVAVRKSTAAKAAQTQSPLLNTTGHLCAGSGAAAPPDGARTFPRTAEG